VTTGTGALILRITVALPLQLRSASTKTKLGLLPTTLASMQIAKVLVFGLPLVAASPAFPGEKCKVAKIVSILKLNKATSFCSSFLGIETSTATAYATVTTTSTKEIDGPTVTSTTYLAHITSTNVVSQTDTATVTVMEETMSTISGVITETSTDETTTTVIYSLGVNGRKRSLNGGPPNRPAFVSGFDSSLISKACSRLSIPVPVTTTTVDETATSVATSTAETVTVDVSVGTTITVESTLLVTSTETATSTTTALTTEYLITGVVTSAAATISRLAVCSPGPDALYNKPLGFPSRLDLDASQYPTSLPDVQACCEACYARQNCVAASYLAGQGTCFFAIANTNTGTTPAPPELGNRCPLGVGGNGVSSPGQGGTWFPGPCVF